MDSSDKAFTRPKTSPPTPKRARKFWIFSVSAVIILLLTAVVIVRQKESLTVPRNIVQSAQSTIYIPYKLPGNYKISETSFSLQEEQVILFWATDGTGGKIVFTEQPKPHDLDFENFYKEQLQDARTLDNVPFPSVTGKTHDQSTMLSIVTPETWIIANTRSPLDADGMKILAEYMKRY